MSIGIGNFKNTSYNRDMTIPELLLEHFLRWQEAEGKRLPAKQFARYIGIGEKSFNLIFNGRRSPTEEQTFLLVTVLKDDRFYELSGHSKPSDTCRIYVDKNWGRLTDKQKLKVAEQISKYTADPVPDCDDEHAATK